MSTEPRTVEALPDLSQETALERLQHRPLVNLINEETMALIASQIAPGCTKGEIGYGLEIAGRYDLDVFAREVWIAKSKKSNKLLVMVGRDGLRKIAQRNGLHVDGDVVRESDELTICRTPDGNRTVAHSYGNPSQRGAVIGAWAEVREGGPLGRPMGYFYAPLSEYMPRSANDYSPWQTQVGVMILAAAERQAIRQATPLSGLLAVGEDEIVFENERESLTSGEGDGSAPGIALPAAVEAVIARAAEVGHSGYADRPTAEISLGGRSPEVIDAWVARAEQDLDALEASHVTDADVAPPDPAAAPQTPAQDASDTLSGGVALPAEIPNSVGSSAAPDSRPAAQEPSAVPLPPDAAAVDMVDIPRDVPIDVEGLPDTPEGEVATDPEVLRRRLADLEAQDTSALDDAHTQLVLDEIEWISSQLAAQDVPPGQESLLS